MNIIATARIIAASTRCLLDARTLVLYRPVRRASELVVSRRAYRCPPARARTRTGAVVEHLVEAALYSQLHPFIPPEAAQLYADFETALYASL
jgi:hypothetical protein